jgi:hypothetical protein
MVLLSKSISALSYPYANFEKSFIPTFMDEKEVSPYDYDNIIKNLTTDGG